MSRPLRIQYCGAWYHVMNRGINRMKIYLNDEHREIFLKLLEEISIRFEVKIHSYCLMENHYHLLLETPHANLSKAMRHLNGLYTQRFNRLENRDGALFRGRYKAILIEAEDYVLKVSRYIHLNPMEAKIVEDPKDYKWSSYKYYMGMPRPHWICISYLLSFFYHEKNYAEFIKEGADIELSKFYNSSPPPILGTSKFIDENINLLRPDYKIATSTDLNRVTKLFDMEKICLLVADYFGTELVTLKKPFKNNQPRMLAIYLIKNLTQLSHQKIADYLTGITRASISTAVIKCKKLITEDKCLQQHYCNLVTKIQNQS